MSEPLLAWHHRLLLPALWALVGMVRALGPTLASNLFGAAMRGIGPLLPPSRIAHANLRMALPDLDAPARRRIVRGVWDNLGRTVAEFPHIATLGEAAAGRGWSVFGREHALSLARNGGAALMFSAHFGNWEVLPKVYADLGLHGATIFRPSGNPALDRVILSLRNAAAGEGALQFAKGSTGARELLAHLRRGGMVGLLPDQKMNDGIESRLFGLPSMTAPALAALALRLRCPVLPSYVRRRGPARFDVIIEPPLPLPDTGDRKADIASLTQAVNDRIESWIRDWPENWLWLHRRWAKDLYR